MRQHCLSFCRRKVCAVVYFCQFCHVLTDFIPLVHRVAVTQGKVLCVVQWTPLGPSCMSFNYWAVSFIQKYHKALNFWEARFVHFLHILQLSIQPQKLHPVKILCKCIHVYVVDDMCYLAWQVQMRSSQIHKERSYVRDLLLYVISYANTKCSYPNVLVHNPHTPSPQC